MFSGSFLVIFDILFTIKLVRISSIQLNLIYQKISTKVKWSSLNWDLFVFERTFTVLFIKKHPFIYKQSSKNFAYCQIVWPDVKCLWQNQKTVESNFSKYIDNLLCRMQYFNHTDSTLTKNKNSRGKIWNKKSVPNFI